MKTAKDVLQKTKDLPPQTALELQHGYTTRRTQGGIPVHRLHYSVHPERDPKEHPEWKSAERKLYTSEAAWQREQEIIDEAGGGELVFADTLVTHWNKIVITAPEWRPKPYFEKLGIKYECEGGFDQGRTNPTVLLRAYVDESGVIYFCGEYYQPGREIWEHVAVLRTMEDITRIRVCYADRAMFDAKNIEQGPAPPGHAQERAKTLNEIYVEHKFALLSPYSGDRSDISFAARLMLHWANLEQREPTVKIVCRNYSEKPQPGLHNWDCPNLLWELMRTRRVKLTAQQLLSRNAAEAIIDKDNHARDAMKYLLMSHPEPAIKSLQERAAEAVKPLAEQGDLTSALIRYQQTMEEGQASYKPARLGRRR